MKKQFRGLVVAAATGVLVGGPAAASDLSYTFMDFQALNATVDAVGLQTPVPLQTVGIMTDSGDGIAVGGSVAAGDHFYIAASYRSSIIDVHAVVSSPLATATVNDDFDLTQTRFALGYLRPLGENLDFVAEASYEAATYDFGSFGGENFDTDDSGLGGQIGFRWNPMRAIELFAFGRYSSIAKSDLSARTLEADSSIDVGVRWFPFDDLGIGVEYESGEIDAAMISMRFSFGNLPW